MSDRETYLNNLKGQFRDDVKMILNVRRFGGTTDRNEAYITEQMKALHTHAISYGLTEDDWTEIVYDLAPQVCGSISFTKIAA